MSVRVAAVVAAVAVVVSGLAGMPTEWGWSWPDWFATKGAAASVPDPERLLVGANGRIEDPVMSSDGRTIVFRTDATNLGSPSARFNVVAWNLSDDSKVTLSNVGVGYSTAPTALSMSDDGRTVAFVSDGGLDGTGAGTWALYVVDPRDPASLRKLPFNGIDASHLINARSLSGDGRYLVFSSWGQWDGASPGQLHVYRYDLQSDPVDWGNNIDHVSVLSDGTQPNGASNKAMTNYSGSVVAFGSTSSNLSPSDTNNRADVFARIMSTGALHRLSRAGSGADVNTLIGVSDDGTRVVFSQGAGYAVSKVVGTPPTSAGDLFPGYHFQADPGGVSADGLTLVVGRSAQLVRSEIGQSAYETIWTAPFQNYLDSKRVAGVVMSRNGLRAVFFVRGYHLSPKSHLYRYNLDPSVPFPPPAGFANGPASASENDVMATTESKGDPVNTLTGNWWWTGTDARTTSPGPSFELSRTYNSTDDRSGLFGRGWSSTLDMSATPTGSGRVVIRTASGATLYFAPNGTGGFTPGAGVLGTLTTRVGGGWSYTDAANLRHDFDAQGRIVAVVDRNGLARSYAYDVAGRLDTVTDPSGRVIDVTVDPVTGFVTEVELPDTRSTSYVYDDGRLVEVTDSAGETVSHTYDYPGRITEVRGPDDEVRMAVTYDGAGRASSVTDALGRVETFAWNPAALTATYTDASGAVAVDRYDGAGRLISQKNPDGGVTTFSWGGGTNPARRAGTITDPLGRVTTNTWDTAGRLLSSTNPEGETTSRTYTPAGDIATVTDPSGKTTTFTRDPGGNVLTVAAPQVGATPSITTITPGPDGQPVEVVDADGIETGFVYNTDGLLEAVTNGEGDVTTFGYDTVGRRTTVVDANGNTPGAVPAEHTWTTVFDDVDRAVETIDPLGNRTTSTFDGLGRLVASEAPDGRTTTWTHDAMGRVTSVTAPGQGTTSWSFDDLARTATRTDGDGHDVTFSFDTSGRLAEAVNELDHTSTWDYDLAGQLEEFTDPTGVTSTLHYDLAGRRTQVDHSDATASTAWVYDLNGRVTSTSNAAQTVAFTYDDQGRTTTQTTGTDEIEWSWTPAGRPANRTQPDGTEFTYSYDDAGRLDELTVDSDTIGLTVDPVGNVVGATYPNGLERVNRFDTAGRLTDLEWSLPGVAAPEVLAAWSFTRDDVGRPASVDRTLGATVDTVSYDYDAAGRLAAECVGPLGSDCATAVDVTEFTFDNVSNMTSRTDATATVTNTFDQSDRLVSSTNGVTVTTNTFDDAGRLTASTDGTTSRTWAWDANSKIVAMGDGAVTTTQTVGPFGLPVAQTDPSGTVDTMWDHTSSGATPALLERGDTRFVSADGSNLLAADVPAVSGPGSDRQWLVTDAQGTPVTAVDDTGVPVAGPVSGDAWGAGTADVAGLGFLGLPESADGSAALRARHMDPAAGAFLSPDPLNDPLAGVFNATSPVVSSYSYGNGSPTVFIDPSGLIGWSDFTGAVSGAVDWAGDAASGAGSWLYENKRAIGTVAAVAGGFALGFACGASVVCGVAVGAVASGALYSAQNAGTERWSTSEFAATMVAGGAFGGLGAGGAKMVASANKAIKALDESQSLWIAATSAPGTRLAPFSWAWGGQRRAWGTSRGSVRLSLPTASSGAPAMPLEKVSLRRRFSAGRRAVRMIAHRRITWAFLCTCAAIEFVAQVVFDQAWVGVLVAFVVLGLAFRFVAQDLVAAMQYGLDDPESGGA